MNLEVAGIVTAIGLLAVLAARRSVGAIAARSPVAARLRTLYTLVAALLALRLAAPLLDATPQMVALMLVAAWLPMAGLRLVEELCRRHAPRLVKLVALTGAIGFSVLAVTLGVLWSNLAALSLALYQLVLLATMVTLLVRARTDLGLSERRTADTFLLALLLTIPLAASDFAAVLPDTPIRGGAFAALLLVVATSRLANGDGSPKSLVADLAVAAGAGGVSVLVARALQPALPGNPAILVGASGFAMGCMLLVVARTGAGGEHSIGLIAALSRTPAGDPDALLAAHPLLASGHLLGPEELAVYPTASIARLLVYPVVSASTSDAEARDAARDLLDAHAATHLIRVSRTPPRLLAVAVGSLSAPALDDELALAARLIEHAA